MNSNNPQVTVLMSVYNGETYLRNSIDSILNQSVMDFEFLIINDASTDHSREIILSYQDPRIRLIDNEKNMGLALSLNKGLQSANGEYIARMDADDISISQRLEKQVFFMESNRDVMILGSGAFVIDGFGNCCGEIKVLTDPDAILAELFFSNPMVHSSTFFRKSFIQKVGLYDANFEKAEDYHLWVRAVAYGGKVVNLSEPLLKYRNHSNNVSNKNSQRQEEIAQLVIKNAYQLLLKRNISLKKIALIRKCLLYGKNSLSWFQKILVIFVFKKIVIEFSKQFEFNSPSIAFFKKRIDSIYY